MSRARPILLLALLTIILVGVLAACRGNAAESPQFVVDEQAEITCSEECVNHGQCGTIDDDPVALAMEGGPAVSLHDRFFLEGALVTILELSQRELLDARNGVPLPESTPFPHTFYRVSSEGKIAWVSEWCLVRP